MWVVHIVLIFVFQDSESSMSEDTGLGSEESSSCECLTAERPLQLAELLQLDACAIVLQVD